MVKFSNKSKKIIRHAETHAMERLAEAITSYDILYGIVECSDTFAAMVLADYGITVRSFDAVRREIVHDRKNTPQAIGLRSTPRVQRAFREAKRYAQRSGSETIGSHHLLIGLLREPDGYISMFFRKAEVNPVEVIFTIFNTYPDEEDIIDIKTEFVNRFSRSAEDGASDVLNELCINMNEEAAAGKYDEIIGRDEEIRMITEVLSRKKKNNACLVGDPGVGKTAVVEGLALHIHRGTVPSVLRNKTVYSMDFTTMVSGTKYRGDFEERMKQLVTEITNRGDVILFIDELHTIIGTGAGDNSLDAANMLKPALARGDIQLIGATTYEEYKKYIETDGALERRFKPLRVAEPSIEQAIAILAGLRPAYQRFHGVQIDDEVLDACVRLSNRYITGRFLPDKAIDLLDEACARKALSRSEEGATNILTDGFKFADYNDRNCKRLNWKEFVEKDLEQCHNKEVREALGNPVTPEDIATVISTWTGIPVGELTKTEAESLLRLESRLNKRIIGQEEAVHALSRAMKRAKAGIGDPDKPLGSFLFCGPSGVGKTETAKQLALELFGSLKNLVVIDMSEYMERHSVSKIIGSPPGYVGYGEGGQLTERVRQNPFSILLFDEIDKAHPDVYNILLQILDEGHIEDAKGTSVNFKNCTIIMTANAGSHDVGGAGPIGFSKDREAGSHARMKSRIDRALRERFKPEFLNRIGEVIVFRPLTGKDLVKIANLHVQAFAERLQLSRGIHFTMTAAAKKTIAEAAYDPRHGARELARHFRMKVEDPVADILLNHYRALPRAIKCYQQRKEIKFDLIGGTEDE
ncbi:MAG: ATP-dependent Clp protease ATP-binding subunit [Eubacteriales bacterium]|nr:ATP-dependent Clp protease ATP-binding subunit [Eubacteriales bacterium]